MNVHAPDRHHGQVRGKRFAIDLPLTAAIQRVCDLRSQPAQVDVIDPAADFLVTGEADADRSVRHLSVSRQIRSGFHDHRYPRLCRRRLVASCRRW